MPRRRESRHELPARVYFRHGAYYYVGVDKKWRNLGRDYNQAMAAWAQLLGTPHTQASVQTVGDLLDRYLLEVVPGKAERTQKDNRDEVRWLRTFFGGMALDQVRPADVADYIAHRKAKTRGNREVALLSHAYNKAILWGLAERNPCSTPGTRNSEKARDRYVTDEEIEKFKEDAPQWLKDYIELKLLLGLRKQDMLALQWKDVGPETLRVTTQKTGKKLAIRVTPEVRTVLSRLSNSSPTIFATRSGRKFSSSGFDSTWKRAMARFISTGGERFTEHDLRGKVATDISDPTSAQKLLGHKRVSMTEDYIKQRQTDVVEPHRRKK